MPRGTEAAAAEHITAALDYWRECRDAYRAAAFFQLYGTPFAADSVKRKPNRNGRRWRDQRPRDQPDLKQVLDSIAEGGYPEAVGRFAALMSTTDMPLPLTSVAARHDFAVQNQDLLPRTVEKTTRG